MLGAGEKIVLVLGMGGGGGTTFATLGKVPTLQPVSKSAVDWTRPILWYYMHTVRNVRKSDLVLSQPSTHKGCFSGL